MKMGSDYFRRFRSFFLLGFLWWGSAQAQGEVCALYPIALSAQTLNGVTPGTVINNIMNGSQPGNFGWLTWAGSPSVPTLVASLTPPGNSHTYVNPDNPNDHAISVGDWVQGKPGVSNSKNVRDALDALKTRDIVIPIWNQTRGQGNNVDYRVSAFANIRLISYNLPGQNKITARFLDYASCGQQNQAPLVEAGSDQTIVLPNAAILDATVTDDGLPSTNALSVVWSVVSGPGAVAFANSNAVDTTATFGTNGVYVLRLTATDTLLSANDSVTITVNRPNQPPEALPQTVATDEDTALPILLQGTDPEGAALTYSIEASPSYGSLSGTPPNMIYTPTNDYFGADSFTFKVHDGQLESAAATVGITVRPVNDAPVADASSVTNLEDVRFEIILSGADLEGAPLTYEIVRPPAFGTLGVVSSNRVYYTPWTDFNGSDSFGFVTCDGALCSATAVVNVAIFPVNDAPVAHTQAVATGEDASTAVTLTGSDVEGDPLGFIVLQGPTNGVLEGAAPNLTYTPNADFNGQDSFTFKANDGSLDSAPATVSITVTAVNDAPVADAQAVTTAEDASLAVTLTGSDVDGDALTFAVATQPAHGALGGTAPDLVYTPNPDYNGPDSFTFTADDDSTDSIPATVSITVTAVNDAPVADAQSVTTAEDAPLAVTLTGSDVDGDALTFAVATQPAHGALDGTAPDLVYTPNPDYNGPDSFTFTANDGSTGSAPATVSITVTAVNDAPVADAQAVTTAEDTPLAIALTGSDVDGDTLTFAVATQPAHGALSGTAPYLVYTPNPNYNGPDSFTFTADDDSTDSIPATVSITVTPVNDAPVAQDQADATDEDVPVAITLAGFDVEGDALTFAVVDAPSHGALTGTPPNLTYTPSADFNGNDNLTFEVSDGALTSALATVTIAINPVNDAPVAQNQAVATDEDVPVAITLAGSDIEGVALTFAVVDAPSHGTLSGTAPNLQYTPAPNYNGLDTFTFTANDGVTDSVPATASITVAPVNDAPTADAQSVSVLEDEALAIVLTGTDVENDSLDFVLVDTPSNGVLIGTAPNLTYTPSTNFHGWDRLTFTANDGEFDSAVAAVEIEVLSVNDAPVADAGDDLLIDFPNQAVLSGEGADDATPVGSVLTYNWSKLTGPGEVAFADAAASNTTATFSAPGVYVLLLTCGDGELTGTDMLAVSVNAAPAVEAGPDQVVDLPNQAVLAGAATDDGLPIGSGLNVAWSQVSGPSPVIFNNAQAAGTTARFGAPGEYVLRLAATDSRLAGQDDLAVSVRPAGPNQAPVVTAGPDMTLGLSASASLLGDASDDGLPWGQPLAAQWSLISGPAAVSFENANRPATAATFGQAGVYVLRLAATDTEFTNSDEVSVTVYPDNLPPRVEAGPDRAVAAPSAELRGTIEDDGLPAGAQAGVQWSVFSGPAEVTLDDTNSAITFAHFTCGGVYVFALSASDGQFSATDQVTLTVSGNLPPIVEAGANQIRDMVIPVLPSNLTSKTIVTPAQADGWKLGVGQPGLSGLPPGCSELWVYRKSMDGEQKDVYVAGIFDYINGVEVRGFGRWDGCGWSAACYQ